MGEENVGLVTGDMVVNRNALLGHDDRDFEEHSADGRRSPRSHGRDHR